MSQLHINTAEGWQTVGYLQPGTEIARRQCNSVLTMIGIVSCDRPDGHTGWHRHTFPNGAHATWNPDPPRFPDA